MSALYFVSGTDTDVGKTVIATGLLAAARQRGLETAAVKPVAAGCQWTRAGWRNDDALALQAVMSRPLDYVQVNPVALPLPASPHLAAAAAGQPLHAVQLAVHSRAALSPAPDFGLVEGAGGWRVPINDRETLADLARELAYPVILVVGLRLGCINHALLSAAAIAADGLPLAGWIGNHLSGDLPGQEAVLNTLRARLPAPCLGVVPHLPQCNQGWPEPDQVAAHLNLDLLRQD